MGFSPRYGVIPALQDLDLTSLCLVKSWNGVLFDITRSFVATYHLFDSLFLS